MSKDIKQIKFKNLSGGLKTAVVTSWIVLGMWTLYFVFLLFIGLFAYIGLIY